MLLSTPPSSDWWPQWINQVVVAPVVAPEVAPEVAPHPVAPAARHEIIFPKREKEKSICNVQNVFIFFRRLGYNYASNNAYTSCHFLDKHKNTCFSETYEKCLNVG